MRDMRKLVLLTLFCAAMLCGAAFARADGNAPRPELLYFFENYCEACHPEVEFIEEFHQLTGRRVDEYAYSWYNVHYEEGHRLFDETAEAHGIAPEDRFLPMVVVDGRVYVGNSKLESALPMDFLENESTDSVLYYLYSPACASCAEAEGVINALPETVTAQRGKLEIDSKIIVNRIISTRTPRRRRRCLSAIACRKTTGRRRSCSFARTTSAARRPSESGCHTC